jgi:hypothetical protein
MFLLTVGATCGAYGVWHQSKVVDISIDASGKVAIRHGASEREPRTDFNPVGLSRQNRFASFARGREAWKLVALSFARRDLKQATEMFNIVAVDEPVRAVTILMRNVHGPLLVIEAQASKIDHFGWPQSNRTQ